MAKTNNDTTEKKNDNINAGENTTPTPDVDTINEPAADNAAPTGEVQSLTDRLPQNVVPGQTLYVRPTKDALLRADRVEAIVIRETNVGIQFCSGYEINANEIGTLILYNDSEE